MQTFSSTGETMIAHMLKELSTLKYLYPDTFDQCYEVACSHHLLCPPPEGKQIIVDHVKAKYAQLRQ